ncbi:MAG: diaminopimelate epimerase [Muribaculaceae bacterium]|nr:diaminopimelate epimerase [Muribaculaceae bacterium]
MEHIKFTKMQGLGNDYIYVDCLSGSPANLASLAREMSDRHKGVGGDGIILILPSCDADFKMRIFNADGSEARMCGNGARCVAKYVYDNNLIKKLHVTLETLSGVKHLFLKPGHDGLIESVTVDMGLPSLLTEVIPVDFCSETFVDEPVAVDADTSLRFTAVSMGNPHAVCFVSSPDDVDIEYVGRAVEFNRLFPDRVNVEFAQILSRHEIRMRVWERGSGVTMACGTGACATVVAAVVNGLVDRDVTVHLDGGDLTVEWREVDNHVYMTGPAVTVFTGVYNRQSQGN